MHLTLADYNLSPKPLVAGVARILREESPFMDSMNFIDVGTLAVEVLREGGMPTGVGWRKVGAAHGTTKGTKPDRVTEQAFSTGHYIDVDKVYIKDRSTKLYDPRTYWTQMTTKAIGRNFNNVAINGDPVVNPDAPAGLRYRLINHLAAAQTIVAAPAGLDISPDSAGLAGNIQIFFDLLDQLIYRCSEHKADMILMNDTLLMRYWSMARQSGLLKTVQDNLGREFYEYKGAKFVDMGFQADDATNIIGNTELPDGSATVGGTSTSMYAFRQGPEFFCAWQEYGMEVEDLGRQDDGVTYRTMIDWVLGFALSHPRSVARMTGLIAL